jgi:sugar (pentulose or hexulose) kinase
MATPVILIFDVGKTNKKVLLFDEQYQIVFEETTQLKETVDEDGFACEDVNLLTTWIQQKFAEISSRKDVIIKAVNFSAYGASFVNLDENFNCSTPLYNYLKPFPETLKQQFYKTYGDENLIAKETASPVLGSLNSGMQLYRLKYEKPEVYKKIKYALHLPQYLSFILSNKTATDISSVGCHTNLWHFKKKDYHDWVYKEELDKKFAQLYNGDKVLATIHNDIKVGIGLHDSSAALIPYLTSFNEPFALISTGTWNISLNPFNHLPLTDEELKQDCLCYLSYKGTPVKASRLFAGYEHENAVKKIAAHFNQHENFYYQIKFDAEIASVLQTKFNDHFFSKGDLPRFASIEEAYHALMIDIVNKQVKSTSLILEKNSIKNIFVDGGFSKNEIFMQLLANSLPGIKVYAASVAQASAIGAAAAIHKHWNKNMLLPNIINLKFYSKQSIS